WAGLVAGVSMEAKYGIAMWAVPMIVGLFLTSARRILAWREFWVGTALAALIAAPSLIWQAIHGWPFLEVVSQHKRTIFTGGPIAFTLQQVAAVNVALAPLWL